MASSLMMVAVAVLMLPNVAPLGLDRLSVKVSLNSNEVSPKTATVIVAVAAPAAKVTVLEGRKPPTKSAALAGLVPLPATAQAAEEAALRSPVRVTVKVNGVVPLLPSLLSALAAAIERDVAIVSLISVKFVGYREGVSSNFFISRMLLGENASCAKRPV